MKPIAPNTLIQNRYLIVHLIGKGGMGEVYLAVDQRLGSAIALKRTFFSDDATLGQAFEREARTLARLRHPALPKVSDHFVEGGTQYLVMEHISGEDMSKRLETAEKLFPVSWVLFWADQLLDALNYLHTHEPPIIHRDIKPQNLKLTDENHIVLLDFGLSKNSVGETRATTGGSIVGYTPHYAAMEQIRGTGTDARSDIYSLAATLYQILTNTVPPDALTRADSLINGMSDPVTPINELNPEVSKAVSDVIIKGMSISQEQRYKSAREMQKALRDAYAKLQNDMSANTIAFNIADPETLPQSPSKTAELTGVPEANKMPVSSNTNASGYNSNATGAKTNAAPIVTGAKTEEPNFDATIGYDAAVPSPVTAKQSDIKTEVFLAGSSDAISAVQGNSYSQKTENNETDYIDSKENLERTSNEVGKAQNYSPDATVPLFSFDKNSDSVAAETSAVVNPTADFNNNKTSAGATFTPVVNETPKVDTFTPPPPPPVHAQPKKGGKGLALAGGLLALLVLAVGAAGIGWYMFKGNNTTTDNETPTPTPAASVTATPTPAPTLEVVSDTNTATNSEVSSTTDNTNANKPATNTVSTPRPTPNTVQTTTQQPVRTTTPRPTPQVVTVKTPTATAKTPTPAKTPKAGRADILQ